MWSKPQNAPICLVHSSVLLEVYDLLLFWVHLKEDQCSIPLKAAWASWKRLWKPFTSISIFQLHDMLLDWTAPQHCWCETAIEREDQHNLFVYDETLPPPLMLILWFVRKWSFPTSNYRTRSLKWTQNHVKDVISLFVYELKLKTFMSFQSVRNIYCIHVGTLRGPQQWKCLFEEGWYWNSEMISWRTSSRGQMPPAKVNKQTQSSINYHRRIEPLSSPRQWHGTIRQRSFSHTVEVANKEQNKLIVARRAGVCMHILRILNH